MIVFDLSCQNSHRFEGWFGSSDEFTSQQARGLMTCPVCGSAAVSKAPMAPAVPAKGNAKRGAKREDSSMGPAGAAKALANRPMPAEVREALAQLAEAQKKALKNSTWVGGKFAEQSRAMHYGEVDEKPIHGQASAEEAKGLIDEGIAIAPLPFPIAEPDKLN